MDDQNEALAAALHGFGGDEPADPEPIPTPEPEADMPKEKIEQIEQRTIRLIDDPAIESRGPYRRGQDYTIPADEAEKLLATGHFEEVSNAAN